MDAGSGTLTREDVALEYNALRAEILKRIELRQQIIAITLTIAGVFLGVGIGNKAVALVYPPIAYFLAVGWAQNDLKIRDLAIYIRERIEKRVPFLGWETEQQKRREQTQGRQWRFIILSHSGIFIFTQFVAMLIAVFGFTVSPVSPVEWVLLGVDVLAVLLVFRLARQVRR